MSEYQPSGIRVSDTEREDALGKLGEHMSAGRLDIDEYGERTAKVATAKTRGELLSLFGDLPEPKPAFGLPLPAAQWSSAGTSAGTPMSRPRTMAERVGPIAIPVAAIVAVGVLVAVFHMGFFVPLLFIFLFMNGSWRGGRGYRPNRDAMRAHQREMRDYHRGRRREWRDERG